LETDLVVTR